MSKPRKHNWTIWYRVQNQNRVFVRAESDTGIRFSHGESPCRPHEVEKQIREEWWPTHEHTFTDKFTE